MKYKSVKNQEFRLDPFSFYNFLNFLANLNPISKVFLKVYRLQLDSQEKQP